MRIEHRALGPLQTNCWIVSDGEGGPLVIIDPADEPKAILEVIGKGRVAAIVLTHCHFDHLAGATELVRATGAPLLVHEDDAAHVVDPVGTGAALFGFDATAPVPDRTLANGDVIEAGAIRLEVLHTPGHTPGSIGLLSGDHLFSGDTVFAGSVGRTDFPRGDSRALARSIAERIALLPDETVVHPGHGPDTTVGRERRVNPFFPRA